MVGAVRCINTWRPCLCAVGNAANQECGRWLNNRAENSHQPFRRQEGALKARQSKSKPIFDDLEARLHAQLTQVSGKSPLAGAIRYALTRMKKLRPWLNHGFLELDNNTAEQSIRPIAMGQKNYLFMGSEGGG
jgi:transposase-like protein